MMPPASAHCASVSRVTQASVTVSQAAAAGGTGQVDPACPLPSPRHVAGDHDVMHAEPGGHQRQQEQVALVLLSSHRDGAKLCRSG